ncbi:MAG: hypothetical protein OXC31_05215 [Spirochaetaceae bacterium]|nr:hypothetical protein [Spirochaetaceae bacterium]
MDVANPIYDVVFMYLMQNQRVARLLIGRITGLAVQSLTVSPQETAVRRTEAVPIVTIYFLGYALDDLSDEAVIDVCPRVTERRTGRELAASHPLVEGIHHRSHIIQIPRLASRRRDELERLLAIFDQGLVKGNGRRDAHVLTIEEGEYPVECAFVLRQLHEAMAEEEVRRTMEGEDLLLLAQAIRRLHGLGQDAEAIAAALAVDADEVRRVLSR